MIHQRLESIQPIVTTRRNNNHQAAAGPKLRRSQRQEASPIVISSFVECCQNGAAASRAENMTGNKGCQLARPHQCIGTPAERDRVRREKRFIKRLAGSKCKYVRLVSQIAAWIGVHHLEQRAEIVPWLVGMENRNGSMRRQGAFVSF